MFTGIAGGESILVGKGDSFSSYFTLGILVEVNLHTENHGIRNEPEVKHNSVLKRAAKEVHPISMFF